MTARELSVDAHASDGARPRFPGRGRPAWFLGSGAISGVFQLGLLSFLMETTALGSLSNAVAFLAAAQLNFLLNHRLTWGDRRRPGSSAWLRQLAGFNGLVLVGAAINQSVYALISQAMPYLLAAGLALLATTALKYLVADRLIFRKWAARPS